MVSYQSYEEEEEYFA